MKIRTFCFPVIALLFLLALTKCTKTDVAYDSLRELDSMAYKYPRYVYNRTQQLQKENTTPYKRAYIGLVMSISAYNSGQEFSSDSLINYAVDEFSKDSDPLSINYLRALIYQGIIRNHIGMIDGKAYMPIKQALDMNREKKVLDIHTEQIANYYLGLIHNKNNNVNTSHEYFREALKLAEKMQDSTVLFKTCRDMYWNRMKGLDFNTARTLLESLQLFTTISYSQLRDIKNAEAAFYNSKRNYKEALRLDYELMLQDRKNNDSVALLADYYRISENYRWLGQLDSALFYGELTIRSIIDTTFYLNYHYYLNLAEITASMNKPEKSVASYKEVYRLQSKAINRQLNTQIMELERKYNVTSAENRAIRLKSSNLLLRLMLITVVLILSGVYLFYRQRIKIQREKEKSVIRENKILEQEKIIAREREKQMLYDKQLTERKLIEKQFVIPIYRQISQRNIDIKNLLLDLQSNTYITKNQALLEKIETEYRNFIKTTKIADTQFLSDALFADLTGIAVDEGQLFNDSEKMMMAFIASGSDNQQMATLLNTSVESIRVRKSKLKKKMEENKVKIPEQLLYDES